MKILIFETAELAITGAAKQIMSAINAKPTSVLGLATGGTMLPLYEQLVEAYREGQVSFADTTTFNLDEYVGIGPEHPCSYHTYMRKTLFDLVDIAPSRTHLPRGDCDNPTEEATEYERKIETAGGIDLQLVGIGQNGHIGFNEPTSSLSSKTRIKTLTRSTRDANARYFERDEDIPKYAITMGVGSILAARHCLMLATGSAKADAVAAMIEGPVSAVCPASALQMHSQATIMLDVDAARKLKLTDYYQHVHPKGAESEWN